MNSKGIKSRPLMAVWNLKTWFPVQSPVLKRRIGWVRAVDGVSFTIGEGETLGLVGESGCGKTTVGRTLVGLYKPLEGEIRFRGLNILNLNPRAMKRMRGNVRMIFQDPFESLNPRHTIRQILEEPFVIHGIRDADARQGMPEILMEKVGMPEDALNRFPHEFSGGQRQRIGIARAIALNPELIICDEPVSALDLSVQAQILNLLMELQRNMNLSLLFIAHDLAVVRHVSDTIAVMYLGRLVERIDAEDIYRNPLHPYTKALISAIPTCDPEKKTEKDIIGGEVPSPADPPRGCGFHTRCPAAGRVCVERSPALEPVGDEDGHLVACHMNARPSHP